MQSRENDVIFLQNRSNSTGCNIPSDKFQELITHSDMLSWLGVKFLTLLLR